MEGHTSAVARAKWLLPAARSVSSQAQPSWYTVKDVSAMCFLGTSRLHIIRNPRQAFGRVTCATCSDSSLKDEIINLLCPNATNQAQVGAQVQVGGRDVYFACQRGVARNPNKWRKLVRPAGL